MSDFKDSHDATPAPDGGKSNAEYNQAHGRVANAPVNGGDRQAAYDALLHCPKASPQKAGWSADKPAKAAKSGPKSTPGYLS